LNQHKRASDDSRSSSKKSLIDGASWGAGRLHFTQTSHEIWLSARLMGWKLRYDSGHDMLAPHHLNFFSGFNPSNDASKVMLRLTHGNGPHVLHFDAHSG
jgi:hypothetical protein